MAGLVKRRVRQIFVRRVQIVSVVQHVGYVVGFLVVCVQNVQVICPRILVMMKIESVPGVLVAASPWARLPNSFPKARAHMCCVMGSSTNFLYFVMDSPMTG